MTQDDIMHMARQAGMHEPGPMSQDSKRFYPSDFAERFAALVAAAELRRLHTENEALRSALRQHIRTYQVDDQHWAPEEEADRLLAMALAQGEKND
jgi:hypothetical protein